VLLGCSLNNWLRSCFLQLLRIVSLYFATVATMMHRWDHQPVSAAQDSRASLLLSPGGSAPQSQSHAAQAYLAQHQMPLQQHDWTPGSGSHGYLDSFDFPGSHATDSSSARRFQKLAPPSALQHPNRASHSPVHHVEFPRSWPQRQPLSTHSSSTATAGAAGGAGASTPGAAATPMGIMFQVDAGGQGDAAAAPGAAFDGSGATVDPYAAAMYPRFPTRLLSYVSEYTSPQGDKLQAHQHHLLQLQRQQYQRQQQQQQQLQPSSYSTSRSHGDAGESSTRSLSPRGSPRATVGASSIASTPVRIPAPVLGDELPEDASGASLSRLRHMPAFASPQQMHKPSSREPSYVIGAGPRPLPYISEQDLAALIQEEMQQAERAAEKQAQPPRAQFGAQVDGPRMGTRHPTSVRDTSPRRPADAGGRSGQDAEKSSPLRSLAASFSSMLLQPDAFAGELQAVERSRPPVHGDFRPLASRVYSAAYDYAYLAMCSIADASGWSRRDAHSYAGHEAHNYAVAAAAAATQSFPTSESQTAIGKGGSGVTGGSGTRLGRAAGGGHSGDARHVYRVGEAPLGGGELRSPHLDSSVHASAGSPSNGLADSTKTARAEDASPSIMPESVAHGSPSPTPGISIVGKGATSGENPGDGHSSPVKPTASKVPIDLVTQLFATAPHQAPAAGDADGPHERHPVPRSLGVRVITGHITEGPPPAAHGAGRPHKRRSVSPEAARVRSFAEAAHAPLPLFPRVYFLLPLS
jgi:hypothetical protein